jgi:hypothetical protein
MLETSAPTTPPPSSLLEQLAQVFPGLATWLVAWRPAPWKSTRVSAAGIWPGVATPASVSVRPMT